MDLPASLLSAGVEGLLFALAALGLIALARKLSWKELGGGVHLNLLLGFAVCLTLIWSMKAGVKPGLNLHLLGAMAATLALARLTGELVGPPLDADHHTREHAQARWRALLAARRLSWSSEEGEWS